MQIANHTISCVVYGASWKEQARAGNAKKKKENILLHSHDVTL